MIEAPHPEMGISEEQALRASSSREQGSSRFLGWWYRLAAPEIKTHIPTVAEREKVRRGRLASILLLALISLGIVALPVSSVNPNRSALISVVIGLLGFFLAVVLNRRGAVTWSGFLIVALLEIGYIVIVVATPGGLTVLDLLLIALMVQGELVAVAVLAPEAVFFVAAFNCLFIGLDIAYQPRDPLMTQLFTQGNAYVLAAVPLMGLHIIVAIVTYLVVRGMLNAISRADRAEEIVELERREAERNRELEEGVRQLLDVHVRLANGDFHVRAQAIRNPLLWQIGNSLNNLIARLSRFAQADFVLLRTQEESRRLAEAIDAWLHGRQAIWPAPSQTPIDPILDALRRGQSRNAAPQSGPMGPQGSSQAQPGMQTPTASNMNRPPSAPSQPTQTNNPLPEWLRPLMPENEQPPMQSRPPAPRSNDPNPWSLDPEVNLPDWLQRPLNDDDSGNY